MSATFVEHFDNKRWKFKVISRFFTAYMHYDSIEILILHSNNELVFSTNFKDFTVFGSILFM